jgi:DNA repair exonuclease SbcCD ATPase subunit
MPPRRPSPNPVTFHVDHAHRPHHHHHHHTSNPTELRKQLEDELRALELHRKRKDEEIQGIIKEREMVRGLEKQARKQIEEYRELEKKQKEEQEQREKKQKEETERKERDERVIQCYQQQHAQPQRAGGWGRIVSTHRPRSVG